MSDGQVAATPISPCGGITAGVKQPDGSVTLDFSWRVGSGPDFLNEDIFVIEVGGDWNNAYIHVPACGGAQGTIVLCRLQSGGAYSPLMPGKAYQWRIKTNFESAGLDSADCMFRTPDGVVPPPTGRGLNPLLVLGGLAGVLLLMYMTQRGQEQEQYEYRG